MSFIGLFGFLSSSPRPELPALQPEAVAVGGEVSLITVTVSRKPTRAMRPETKARDT